MYGNMTDDFLRERMLGRIAERMDTRPSSLIYDAHAAAAMELAVLYVELDYLIKNSYGDTAARESLILLCKDRGIVPEPATCAVLKGEFTPVGVDVSGKRFNIGDVNYTVLERIEPGKYKVQCETEGVVGNRHLGQMIPMEYTAGLKTAELTGVLIPGKDEEDTETLRQRYFASFSGQSFGGNCADYLEKVRSLNGVGEAKVTRVWNGNIRPADLIPSNSVKEWYESVIGNAPEEAAAWLSAVYTAAAEKKLTAGGTVLVTIVDSDDFGEASGGLIDYVQTILDPVQNAGEGQGTAPIGHVVNVKSASAVRVWVASQIVFRENFGWSNLREVMERAVEDYFLELRKQWADNDSLVVRISQIESRLLAVDGVVDVTETKLNGRAENLTLGKDEIPVLGGVSA